MWQYTIVDVSHSDVSDCMLSVWNHWRHLWVQKWRKWSEFRATQKRNRNGEEQFVDRYVNRIVNLKILFRIDWKKDLTQESFSLNVRIYVCTSTSDSHLLRSIRHFHISHNAPYLPSPNFASPLFFISPGYYSRAKRNWKQCLSKILGANKVHYGQCGSGVLCQT